MVLECHGSVIGKYYLTKKTKELFITNLNSTLQPQIPKDSWLKRSFKGFINYIASPWALSLP